MNRDIGIDIPVYKRAEGTVVPVGVSVTDCSPAGRVHIDVVCGCGRRVHLGFWPEHYKKIPEAWYAVNDGKADDIKDGETVCEHNMRPFECFECQSIRRRAGE